MKTLLICLNLLLASVLVLLYARQLILHPAERPALVLIVAAAEETTEYGQVRAGVDSFEERWGHPVTVISAQNEPRELARALKQAIALKPTGISMPGHGESELLLPFVTEAQRQGIRLTFHTTPMPEAQARFRHRGTGYIGAGSAADGAAVVRAVLTPDRFDPGDRILVIGRAESPRPGSRIEGCMKTIEELGGAPEYVQVATGSADPEHRVTSSDLAEQIGAVPRPAGIFWDAGDPSTLTAALGEANLRPNESYVTSFAPAVALARAELDYIQQIHIERHQVSAYTSLVQLVLSNKHEGFHGMHVPLFANAR